MRAAKLTESHQLAAEVTVTCPACRDDKHKLVEVYEYARAYLCDDHAEVWDAQDGRVHRALGGECPWEPQFCRRCS